MFVQPEQPKVESKDEGWAHEDELDIDLDVGVGVNVTEAE